MPATLAEATECHKTWLIHVLVTVITGHRRCQTNNIWYHNTILSSRLSHEPRPRRSVDKSSLLTSNNYDFINGFTENIVFVYKSWTTNIQRIKNRIKKKGTKNIRLQKYTLQQEKVKALVIKDSFYSPEDIKLNL